MTDKTTEILKNADIRPSYQRVTILKVLRSTTAHPTAEALLHMVNEASEVEISRATLYNTLQLFSDKGIICHVDMDSAETHFEPNTHFHPHFVCTRCKKIFDVTGELPVVDVPEGFVAQSYTVNVSGVCAECSKEEVNR